jgi:hypothetical protein
VKSWGVFGGFDEAMMKEMNIETINDIIRRLEDIIREQDLPNRPQTSKSPRTPKTPRRR